MVHIMVHLPRNGSERFRSSADAGGVCQVNFGEEHAVYCAAETEGYRCACGPAQDAPLEFSSADICDLEPEERACVALAECGFTL